MQSLGSSAGKKCNVIFIIRNDAMTANFENMNVVIGHRRLEGILHIPLRPVGRIMASRPYCSIFLPKKRRKIGETSSIFLYSASASSKPSSGLRARDQCASCPLAYSGPAQAPQRPW